jgi:hypothetical protein
MFTSVQSKKGRAMEKSGSTPGGREPSRPASRGGKDPHLESLISQWKKGERDKGKKRRDSSGKKKK